MKFKTTQKAIKANYPYVISIGYCNLQTLLNYKPPIAYTTRREGWGADIYEVSLTTVIVTGYAPFGNIRPDYEIQRKYEEMAQTILYGDSKVPFEHKREALDNLLHEFINEVIGE